MLKRNWSRSRYLLSTMILAATTVGVFGGWYLANGNNADAGPKVMITRDNTLVIDDSPGEALRRASAMVGYTIPRLASARYELTGGAVPAADDSSKAAQFIYKNPGAEFGTDRVTFIIVPGTQRPAAFGRENEPEPEALPVNVAGLTVVRLKDVSGAVVFTAWKSGRTYSFAFYPPNPSDKEMLDIVLNTLR
jgi:hypothetical protein